MFSRFENWFDHDFKKLWTMYGKELSSMYIGVMACNFFGYSFCDRVFL